MTNTTSAHATCSHEPTKAERARCRRLNARKAKLFPMIDEALRVTYDIAIQDRFNDVEYQRAWRVVEGLIMAYVDGDAEDAAAIKVCWLDCNEFPGRYMSWSRDARVYNAGTWADRDAMDELERRLGLGIYQD